VNARFCAFAEKHIKESIKLGKKKVFFKHAINQKKIRLTVARQVNNILSYTVKFYFRPKSETQNGAERKDSCYSFVKRFKTQCLTFEKR